MWPHQQIEVVEEAGGRTFDPAVNAETGKSGPWSASRAATIVKKYPRMAGISVTSASVPCAAATPRCGAGVKVQLEALGTGLVCPLD